MAPRTGSGARWGRSSELKQLRVDWQVCDGHGLCAELLPEVVRLDEWGFPVVERPVPRHLERLARQTVAACPKLALQLRSP